MTFEAIDGDADYRAFEAQRAAEHNEDQVDHITGLYVRLQGDHAWLASKHEALFARFDAIANDTDETGYLRDRVKRELVAHIKEWN